MSITEQGACHYKVCKLNYMYAVVRARPEEEVEVYCTYNGHTCICASEVHVYVYACDGRERVGLSCIMRLR